MPLNSFSLFVLTSTWMNYKFLVRHLLETLYNDTIALEQGVCLIYNYEVSDCTMWITVFNVITLPLITSPNPFFFAWHSVLFKICLKLKLVFYCTNIRTVLVCTVDLQWFWGCLVDIARSCNVFTFAWYVASRVLWVAVLPVDNKSNRCENKESNTGRSSNDQHEIVIPSFASIGQGLKYSLEENA